MRHAPAALAILVAASGLASAQTWDTSGNGMLNGTYYFRETAYSLQDYAGDLNYAAAVYGNISFDGNGNYTFNATLYDSQGNYGRLPPVAGTYAISASGYGYISSLVANGAKVYGLVGQGGIFVASATESYFDLFIAAPVGSSPATVSTFKGTYWIADFDPSGGSPLYTANYMYQLNPDGAGSLGNITLTGYIGNYGSSLISQTVSAPKYAFQNGAGILGFPVSSNAAFVSGQEYLYISPDGNFVFGGSPQSWDMFVGVRMGSGAPSFNGLYYQAGMDEDTSTLSGGYATLDAYYGALNAVSGSVIGHQRLQYTQAVAGSVATSGYTYSAAFAPKSDGTYSDSFMRYAVGANGAIRIGSGIGPSLGLHVALAAPNITGSGVFILPQYVVNAATFAPFTAGISPGEFVTIAGQNLSDSTATASSLPFPNKLGNNVQVLVNGLAAPLYVVTPTYISFLVPYAVSASATAVQLATVQVVNNGTASNTVTVPVHLTTPGVFTVPSGGLGPAAALHADYSLVSPTKPAQPGETILVFVTGLGAVTPLVPDGSAGPSNPLSTTSNTVAAYINGQSAKVDFSGLAPGLGGLYQVNLEVPSGLASGTYALDIAGPDGYSSEATVAVGPAAGQSAQPMAARRPGRPR